MPYYNHKTLTMQTALKWIKEGKIECVTDLKYGFTEVRYCATGTRSLIYVKYAKPQFSK